MSAVNLSEVIAKLQAEGTLEPAIRQALQNLSLIVAPFNEAQAYEAGLLRASTRVLGLSFGDRACLALARSMDLPAYTADQAWGRPHDVARVVVIR